MDSTRQVGEQEGLQKRRLGADEAVRVPQRLEEDLELLNGLGDGGSKGGLIIGRRTSDLNGHATYLPCGEKMREFQQLSKTKKVRVWRIDADGDQVITEFGEDGGAMQRVVDTAKEKYVGQSNYMTAEQVAVETMEREIELKTRGGYIEVGSDVERVEEIDFARLPTNLSFYKPDNTMSTALAKKLEAKKAWLSRKRDGEMMVIAIDGDRDIQIYSRKMLPTHDKENIPWGRRFGHIVDSILNSTIPENSILLGEMVMNRPGGADDRWHVATVLKSLTPRSLKQQSEEGHLSYYCWDIAFWSGEDLVKTRPVRERYELIQEHLCWAPYILPVDVIEAEALLDIPESEVEAGETYNKDAGVIWNRACYLAHASGWEGWVIVDPDGIYGDSGYNFRGKTDRPGRYCGKLKPVFEDDLVVFWDPDNKLGQGKRGSYGTGKYQGMIGAVELFQFDSEGTLHYISECGNGFAEKDLKELSDPNSFPMVMAIEYTSRTYVANGQKTNALQFPTFLRVREDNLIEECVNPRLDNIRGNR